MIIDERKVNLAEKDIEQWLWENPGKVKNRFGSVQRWLKRQYKVPSGVIDLIGLSSSHQVLVVEIKNTEIEAGALTQVCRYAADIEYVYQRVWGTIEQEIEDDITFWQVGKVVVGRSISSQAMMEAEALGVHIITFGVTLSLSLGEPSWTDEFLDERQERRELLSQEEDWGMAVWGYIESCRQYRKDHDLEGESFASSDSEAE